MFVSKIVTSPLVDLFIEANEEGISLVRPATILDRPCGTSEILDDAQNWFYHYFGDRIIPVLPPVSLHSSPFRMKVWQELLSIPFGKTSTYGKIAKQVDCRSSRAVGGAVGANPIMIMIPCHRVLSATGLGGYAYGGDLKEKILAHEGYTSICHR